MPADTKIYVAPDSVTAAMIRDWLVEAGIECELDLQPSPLDGITTMGQGVPMFVPAEKYEHAMAAIEEYFEYHEGASEGADEEE
jgi:hypothetical protein